ncbi:MAG TPA: hypothetical protein VF251_14630 [Pyrinomonadaceae bacterium]
MNQNKSLLTLVLVVAALCTITTNAFAQSREHLTPQEIDLIKEAQMLDKRIDVFIKAIDRRLMAMNGSGPANAKQLKKDAEKWGELPTGSRADLVSDIARIFDEAITNIDDVSARDERNPLIPKALRKLVQSVNSVQTQLAPLKDQAKSEAEVASFELLNEDAQSILEAAKKLPPEVETRKAKNKQ